jgi:hypothetical protein
MDSSHPTYGYIGSSTPPSPDNTYTVYTTPESCLANSPKLCDVYKVRCFYDGVFTPGLRQSVCFPSSFEVMEKYTLSPTQIDDPCGCKSIMFVCDNSCGTETCFVCNRDFYNGKEGHNPNCGE